MDSNYTSADYNGSSERYYESNVDVIADPMVNGWNGMSESSNVMVRVVAVDFEGLHLRWM